MAKVRCARCGEIFALQQGEIQVCPRCGCRMRVNRRPQAASRPAVNEPAAFERPVQSNKPVEAAAPAPEADEYESLRREYMEMMRTKISNKPATGDDGVYLSKEEYNALLAKNTPGTISAVKVPEASVITAPQEYAPAAPTPHIADAYATQSGASNNFDPYTGEPLNARAPADTFDYVPKTGDDDYEDEPARAPVVTNKKGKVAGWISFVLALGAGVMAALLLVFDLYREGKYTGMKELVPEGGWLDIKLIFNPIIAVCLFLPALLAVFSLITAIRQGKGGKFFLFVLYLIAGAALLVLPFIVQLSNGNFDFSKFNFDTIVNAINDNGAITLIAAGICFAACIAALIAGILNKSRKSRRAAEVYSDDEVA